MSAMTVDRKVMAGGAGGALALVTCWILELNHIPVPVYIALSFQTIFVFGLQWAVPNKEISNASQNTPASG